MLLDEHFPQLARGRARILATDISSDMVARGAAGLYSRVEVNRGLPAPLLVKYFQEEGSQWRLKAPLRAMVEFREHNLVTEDPPLPGVDILFLRNVLIYFELATKKAVLEKLKALLNPGGILFLGAAETTLNIDNGFAPVRSSRAIWYRAPRRPSGLRLIK
jgi:chemotaxis protein methyltransferase CheR